MRVFERRLELGMAVALTLLATAGAGMPPSRGRQEPARPVAAPPAGISTGKPDLLAQRLCDTLHAVPAARKSECCGTTSVSLAGVCAQELRASLRRGAVTVDARGIDRCTEETSRRLEGCAWVTPLTPSLPDACSGLIHGTLKAKAACRSSLECADGLYCRGAAPTRAGVCSSPAPARARCEIPADNLAGLTRAKDDPRHPECQGRCLRGVCFPFVPAGGACGSSALCAPGHHCIAGRCQDRPLPKLGESCAGNTACDAGAYCQAGECVALKDAGEPCTRPFECRAFACVKAPGASAGACGEPCGPDAVKPSGPLR